MRKSANGYSLLALVGVVMVLFSAQQVTDFHPLVDHTPRLSGTYGELRSNHFHAGIDIKSKNRASGDPLYAPQEGFVSRIASKAGGYGRALYIDHPDGTTTVYAHLQAFTKEVEDYVHQQRYSLEIYEVNLFPPRDSFRFDRGDVIGYMGNSGHSFGPHLHFEMRHTESEIPINPLLHGWDIEDDIPPEIRALKVNLMDRELRPYDSRKLYPRSKGQGRYSLGADTLQIGAWRVGFLAKAYDKMNKSYNSNGIYRMLLKVDGQRVFGFQMDSIAFHESRYINAHIDFPERVKNKEFYNRLYRLPANELAIYEEYGKAGIVQLYATRPRKIEVEVSDTEGNTSILEFWVKRDVQRMKTPSAGNWTHSWYYDDKQTLEIGRACFHFEQGTFYQDPRVQFSIDTTDGTAWDQSRYQIDFLGEPLHIPYQLSIKASEIPLHLRPKVMIARQRPDGTWENQGGEWTDDVLSTTTREAGTFAIRLDTVAPRITPSGFRQNMRGRRSIVFQLSDNMPTGGSAQKLQIRGEIDGQWVLFKHTSRRDRITYEWDDRCPPGEHTLVLKVTDDRGNEAVWERDFVR